MPGIKKVHLYIMLIGAIILQLLILAGEYLNSVYPLWIGEEIRLAVRPVDPRSLFRGNYARLDYEIGSLSSDIFGQGEKTGIRRGSLIYLSLEKQGEKWVPTRASLDRPSQGTFIRGRVRDALNDSGVRVRYSIEAYFAPKDKALEIENRIRKSRSGTGQALALVMIAPNGKAALSGIRLE